MESVTCEIKYSGAAMAFLLAATAATLLLVLALPLSGALRAAVAMYLLASAARACRALTAVTGLHLAVGRGVKVRDAGGSWVAGEVRDGGLAMAALTVLRWRPEGARWDRTVLLLPGMASPDALRRLRVILRLG